MRRWSWLRNTETQCNSVASRTTVSGVSNPVRSWFQTWKASFRRNRLAIFKRLQGQVDSVTVTVNER